MTTFDVALGDALVANRRGDQVQLIDIGAQLIEAIRTRADECYKEKAALTRRVEADERRLATDRRQLDKAATLLIEQGEKLRALTAEEERLKNALEAAKVALPTLPVAESDTLRERVRTLEEQLQTCQDEKRALVTEKDDAILEAGFVAERNATLVAEEQQRANDEANKARVAQERATLAETRADDSGRLATQALAQAKTLEQEAQRLRDEVSAKTRLVSDAPDEAARQLAAADLTTLTNRANDASAAAAAAEARATAAAAAASAANARATATEEAAAQQQARADVAQAAAEAAAKENARLRASIDEASRLARERESADETARLAREETDRLARDAQENLVRRLTRDNEKAVALANDELRTAEQTIANLLTCVLNAQAGVTTPVLKTKALDDIDATIRVANKEIEIAIEAERVANRDQEVSTRLKEQLNLMIKARDEVGLSNPSSPASVPQPQPSSPASVPQPQPSSPASVPQQQPSSPASVPQQQPSSQPSSPPADVQQLQVSTIPTTNWGNDTQKEAQLLDKVLPIAIQSLPNLKLYFQEKLGRIFAALDTPPETSAKMSAEIRKQLTLAITTLKNFAKQLADAQTPDATTKKTVVDFFVEASAYFMTRLATGREFFTIDSFKKQGRIPLQYNKNSPFTFITTPSVQNGPGVSEDASKTAALQLLIGDELPLTLELAEQFKDVFQSFTNAKPPLSGIESWYPALQRSALTASPPAKPVDQRGYPGNNRAELARWAAVMLSRSKNIEKFGSVNLAHLLFFTTWTANKSTPNVDRDFPRDNNISSLFYALGVRPLYIKSPDLVFLISKGDMSVIDHAAVLRALDDFDLSAAMTILGSDDPAVKLWTELTKDELDMPSNDLFNIKRAALTKILSDLKTEAAKKSAANAAVQVAQKRAGDINTSETARVAAYAFLQWATGKDGIKDLLTYTRRAVIFAYLAANKSKFAKKLDAVGSGAPEHIAMSAPRVDGQPESSSDDECDDDANESMSDEGTVAPQSETTTPPTPSETTTPEAAQSFASELSALDDFIETVTPGTKMHMYIVDSGESAAKRFASHIVVEDGRTQLYPERGGTAAPVRHDGERVTFGDGRTFDVVSHADAPETDETIRLTVLRPATTSLKPRIPPAMLSTAHRDDSDDSDEEEEMKKPDETKKQPMAKTYAPAATLVATLTAAASDNECYAALTAANRAVAATRGTARREWRAHLPAIETALVKAGYATEDASGYAALAELRLTVNEE